MLSRLPPLDQSLLNGFQRDFPLHLRPFAWIAAQCGSTEAEVLTRLKAMQAEGRIARVGATVRPNTAGASTLAAMRIPEDRLEEVANRISEEPGVNHSYLREHEFNLWFVLTAPNTAELEHTLHQIRTETGIDVLDLRLVRPFNIDLGFALDGAYHNTPRQADPDVSILQPTDRPLLEALSRGLDLTSRPFAALGRALDRSETEVIARIGTLHEAGILTRIGIIVRHRSIGWSSNAMVVWNVPEDRMIAAGTALAACPGITLCYQRRSIPGTWEYGLYSMIHARSRDEALAILSRAAALPELAGCTHKPLFSVRCYKQTGARFAKNSKVA